METAVERARRDTQRMSAAMETFPMAAMATTVALATCYS